MKQVFITAVKPPLGVSVSQLGVSGFETLFYIPASHLAVTVPWEMNQQMEYLLASQIKKNAVLKVLSIAADTLKGKYES